MGYNLGCEVYREDESVAIDATIQHIQNLLIQRAPSKYESFLKMMKSTKTLLLLLGVDHIHERMNLLMYTYFAMRIIDDIADNDVLQELPITEKSNLMAHIKNGNYTDVPLIEQLMREIKRIVAKLNIAEIYHACLEDIVSSVHTDFVDATQGVVYKTQEEIRKNIMLENTGTTLGTCMILGIDPNNVMQIMGSVTYASRLAYNIRDLPKDLKDNLIRIPKEDIDRFGITEEDIRILSEGDVDIKYATIPASIAGRIRKEIGDITSLVQQYKASLSRFGVGFTGEQLQWNDSSPLTQLKNNSLMVYAWKKMYLDKIHEILDDARYTMSGLKEMGLNLPSYKKSPKGQVAQYILVKYYNYISKGTLGAIMKKAEGLCFQYRNSLEITPNEYERYIQKAKNLSVFYAGLLGPGPYGSDHIDGSAKAGFLSAAYDVSTDRNRDISSFKEVFTKILQEQTSPDLVDMTMSMFERDIGGVLSDYGLERGSVSLCAICNTLGISDDDFLGKYGVHIKTMGRYLQMVDDVLDVEQDLDEGQINFMKFPIKKEYIDDFIIFFSQEYFPKTYLQCAISMSMKKAKRIKSFFEKNRE